MRKMKLACQICGNVEEYKVSSEQYMERRTEGDYETTCDECTEAHWKAVGEK